jgi:hypothetical protein
LVGNNNAFNVFSPENNLGNGYFSDFVATIISKSPHIVKFGWLEYN